VLGGAAQPTADEVRDFPEPFGALMLELPLRDAGFVLPSWEELSGIVEAAHERDAVVHFDGARLWESAPHFGRPLDEMRLASVLASRARSEHGPHEYSFADLGLDAEAERSQLHRYQSFFAVPPERGRS